MPLRVADKAFGTGIPLPEASPLPGGDLAEARSARSQPSKTRLALNTTSGESRRPETMFNYRRFDHFIVVEKEGRAREVVTRTDPRKG